MSHTLPAPRLPAPLVPGAVRLLLAAGIALPLVIFLFAAYGHYRVLEDEAHRRASRGAEVAREHALRAFAVYELILDQVQRVTADARWPALVDAREIHEHLHALDARSEGTTSVFAVSADGTQWISSRRFPMPRIDGSDREFIRHFRDGGAGVLVSGALHGRLDGDPFFAFARELRPGKPFDGVAGVSVRIDYFHEVYAKLVEGPEDVIAMARADGAVLARFPRAFEVGYVFPPHSGLMQAILTADEGFFPARARLDGVDRIYAYRKVGSYPVYVTYGLSRSAVWGPWRQNVALFALVTAMVITLLTFATRQAADRARREREALEQWAAEQQRRQSAEEALRNAQRLEALGKLTGGVAHDFNNVLQVLKVSVEVLRRNSGVPGASLAGIERAVEQGTRLTRQLLTFSREQTLAPERIAVAPFIEGLSTMLRQSVGGRTVVDLQVAADTRDIEVDPHELELAILNLAINSRDAMPDGGTLTIEAANASGVDRPAGLSGDRDYVRIGCRDTGSGMAPEVVERVFEPFFTTKPIGQGTGLGLAQVYGFITRSGGTVTVESVVGTGTEFVLWLPAASMQARAADAADSASAA